MIDAGGGLAAAAGGEFAAQHARAARLGLAGAHADQVVAVAAFQHHGEGATVLLCGQPVGQHAVDAARPRRWRQHIHRVAVALPVRLQAVQPGAVAAVAVQQVAVQRGGEETGRRLMRADGAVQRGRGDVQVGLAFAIGVVIQGLAQLLQRGGIGLAQPQAARQRLRRLLQVVAKRGRHGPVPVASVQVAVHQDAGAHVRGGVAMQRQARVALRLGALGGVVVEPGQPRAAVQQPLQLAGVGVQ
ncbi:conserved hypothetical protein [Ricinus communis]|uniref:Uncharacterized protein n=1 Tax=Ricinus communis TaxID=3988 RepID=B9TJ13_RICCO|nr:conserved hypothetical protein [Ricinus communis]